MRALVFNGDLKVNKDYMKPEPGPDEALIRVIVAGICNTDLELTKGYMGFSGVPGHEFVGIVESCSKKSLIGKRVVGEINIACGQCYFCRNNLKTHCPKRSVLGILNKDGAFAEYITLPLGNIHKVPASVTNEEAVFVEPLAAAFEVLEQIQIQPSDKVCVLGDGKLGLLVAQVLASTGCNLVTVGKHMEKLSILDEIGIRTRIYSAFGEKGFDVVVECTGAKAGIETAQRIIRPKGKIVLKTTTAGRNAINLNDIVINEVQLIGSRCGPFKPAIEAISQKKIDLLPLISERLPLEDGVGAFRIASRKGILKVLLDIS